MVETIKRKYQNEQQSPRVVVYTYGVWDLPHVGHIRLLKEARALGDKLIVGVYTDKIAQSFKRNPVISQEQRLEIIYALECVDAVVYQDEFLPDTILREYKPAILAKGPGASWEKGKKVPGEDVIKEWHGKVIFLDYHDIISSTEIIKRCKLVQL